MEGSELGVHFLNLSYFFRIIYEMVFGGGTPEMKVSGLLVFISNVWTVVTILAILVSLVAIGVLVYATMRLYQIREEEE
ncbi:MAG TPA: hypothetical protein VF696_00020, partial [Candidatus Paceibacterota bacterium]